MTNREIGEMIKTRRLSRGMTQAQLAAATNISESAIAMYEAGRRKPKDVVVEALADVFNVPKWAILYREDEMIPESNVSDDEIMQLREDMRRNPELRALWSIQRKATVRQVQRMKDFAKGVMGNDAFDETDAP